MADYVSDSPNQSAPAGHGNNQRNPSAAQAHHKRNNRNRKNNAPADGTVSDGAVVNPAASPRPKKAQQAHKQRQSVAGTGAVPIQQNGKPAGQKPRPVSYGGGLLPATPAKEQAYAGATFQASPAPASLPMPKFFSRSVPNGGNQPSLQGRLAGDKTPEKQESSPDSDHVSPAPPPRAQESPLDFFFKADRDEKERMRNGSAPSLQGAAARPSPPPSGPRNPFQQSGKNSFMRELDGDEDDMPSPRTVAPNGRPPAARQHSSPAIAARPAGSDEERRTHTQALKDQLFNIAGTPPRDHSRNHSGSQTPDGVFGSPSPLHQSSSGPTTPQPSSDQQQSQYSLHYNGQMNLSPLFQKARAETPSRPRSSLRQEVPSDVVSNADSAVDVQPSGPHTNALSPNTFARSYLKEQIRTSGPAEMPDLSFQSGTRPYQNHGNMPFQPAHQQYGAPGQAPSTTPRSNGSHDIKSMEDDMRRILKLNVSQ